MTEPDQAEPTVLSALEFDVLWEVHQLGARHIVLDLPSPGTTHSERAELVEQAWRSLSARRLANGRTVSDGLLDLLEVIAKPTVSIDVWAWAQRQVRALAAAVGDDAVLCLVDGGEVWLVQVEADLLAESAVSVIGELGGGVGGSVSLPYGALAAADAKAHGDAAAMVTALADRGVTLYDAQELAGMLIGMVARGQFGVQRRGAAGTMRRADRVVSFHDTDAGRYLVQVEANSDDEQWCTVTPADNQLLAERVWDLIGEA